MMSNYQKIKGLVVLLLLFALGGLTLILLVAPVVVCGLLIRLLSVSGIKTNDRYQQFLQASEGRYFFVYTSKKETTDFVMQRLLPVLPAQLQVAFLNGRNMETNIDTPYVSMLVHGTRIKGGFPWIIQVRGGKPRTVSVNRELYQALQKNDPGLVLSSIQSFISS